MDRQRALMRASFRVKATGRALLILRGSVVIHISITGDDFDRVSEQLTGIGQIVVARIPRGLPPAQAPGQTGRSEPNP